MSAPLLSTKLHIPSSRAYLVPRPRLIELLDLGRSTKLTLVCAPTGYGKTTLLCQWLAGCSFPFAWLSLDEADNDPVRFLSYLVAAVQQIEPDLGTGALDSLRSSGVASAGTRSPMELALTLLLNEIASIHDPFSLVLDDYHLIQSTRIHEAVSFLLDNQPPPLHLVIATRVDPPLPVARLRAQSQLVEVRVADLCFTADEASAFLNDVMGLVLPTEQVAALERRTEGWIAGLQLAALSMQEHDDIPGFIEAFTGSHRFVLDYLTEEVFNRQTADVQAFLLDSAILDHLTAPLCDAITGRADSQEILEALDAANLFIIPLDDERRWYRYHHLFADLLRQRLQRERHDRVPELHRRASKWYEENGLIFSAVSQALASRDFVRAADLIEQSAWSVLMRGELATLLSWSNDLPDELLRSRPQLVFFNIWALAYSGALDEVEQQLQNVDLRSVQGEVATVRAHVAAVRGDVSGAIAMAHQASEYLPAENVFLRGLVAQTLGLAYHWSGNPAAASQELTEAITLSQAAEEPYLTMTATAFLGRALEMQGALHQAVDTYQKMFEMATGMGRRPVPFAGMAYVGIAGPLYEWNDLDGAVHHATEGIKQSERGGFVPYQLAGSVIITRVHLARGDMPSTLEAMEETERLAQKCDYAYVLALVDELRVLLWMARGKMAAASQWAKEHRLSRGCELNLALEVEQIAVARIDIALALQRRARRADEASEALRHLSWLLEGADAAGRMGSVIKLLVLKAIAFQIQGDEGEALSTLERALSIAEPEGYVRVFLNEGAQMAELLRRAGSQGIKPQFVAKLVSAFKQIPSTEDSAGQPLIEPLSKRELEVLHLLANGLSNFEIADKLVITVGTVKAHTASIYRKLNVNSRLQAVARARELDLP